MHEHNDRVTVGDKGGILSKPLTSHQGMSLPKLTKAMSVVVDEIEAFVWACRDTDEAKRDLERAGLVDVYNACWGWLNEGEGSPWMKPST